MNKYRYNDYYEMTETLDELYQKAKSGKSFNKLMDIISSDNNIRLAFRMIKSNTGSNTAGTDGITIKEIKDSNIEEYVQLIQEKLKWYKPDGVEKETKPPQPYTEGTLITAMKTAGKTVDSEEAQSILKEVEGIGTEATRANIIETLKQKEYIKVEKNKLVVTNKGILLCQAVEKEPLLTSAEMTAKWESYLLKIGERKGTQTTFLANIQKFVSHLLEVVPGQIQSTDFGSTLQEVKAASEKQEAARHLGICPKCQEQEVLLYQKVAACTSEACDFKLWTTIAKKKLTATQLKEIIQNGRTSQPVKGLKGQKGSFEATIVLKEDFTTGFEFSEKKKTNFKKRTRRTTK